MTSPRLNRETSTFACVPNERCYCVGMSCAVGCIVHKLDGYLRVSTAREDGVVIVMIHADDLEFVP